MQTNYLNFRQFKKLRSDIIVDGHGVINDHAEAASTLVEVLRKELLYFRHFHYFILQLNAFEEIF